MSASTFPPTHGILTGWTKPAAPQPPQPIWAPRDSHLITVAPTGAGKGVGCIIPALLTWPGPAIVIDPKGENFAVTARRRRELGQDVALFDPFDVAGTGTTAALNPFDLFNHTPRPTIDDAAVIAGLCVQERSLKDPFWDERAQTLIAGLVLHVALSASAPLRSLSEVRYQVEASHIDQDFTTQNMRHLHDPDLLPAANILSMASDRTRASIITTASSHLSFLTSGPVHQSLSRSTLDIGRVTRGEPLTVYLVLPPDKLATHAKLLRVWLGLFMTVLARRRQIPRQPTLFLVDEAAQLGRLNELLSAVTLMRGYGVRVWTFWQDLAQLAATYPADWTTILNNCAVQQFFRPATPFAAAALEAYLAGTAPLPLSKMDSTDAILIRDGRPILVRRPNYLTDAYFSGMADPNPFHLHASEPPPTPPATHNVIPFPQPVER